MSALKELCKVTETKQSDWESIDGPESGCGIDYWFRNKKTGREAYVNEDQGDFTIDAGNPEE